MQFKVGDIVEVDPKKVQIDYLYYHVRKKKFVVRKTFLGTRKDIISIDDLDGKQFLDFFVYAKNFILVERKQIKEIDLKDFNDLYI